MQEMSCGRIIMQYNYQNQYKNLKYGYRVQDNILNDKLTKLLGIWYISDFGIVVNIRMEMKFDESNVDISITTNQK